MRKDIEKLINSKVSAAEIARNTGLDASTIQKLRLGQRDIGKLSLENAEKLSDFSDSNFRYG